MFLVFRRGIVSVLVSRYFRQVSYRSVISGIVTTLAVSMLMLCALFHTKKQSESVFFLFFFLNLQAFSKKKTDDRKEWLTNFMEDRRQRRMHGLPEVCGLSFEMMKE